MARTHLRFALVSPPMEGVPEDPPGFSPPSEHNPCIPMTTPARLVGQAPSRSQPAQTWSNINNSVSKAIQSWSNPVTSKPTLVEPDPNLIATIHNLAKKARILPNPTGSWSTPASNRSNTTSYWPNQAQILSKAFSKSGQNNQLSMQPNPSEFGRAQPRIGRSQPQTCSLPATCRRSRANIGRAQLESGRTHSKSRRNGCTSVEPMRCGMQRWRSAGPCRGSASRSRRSRDASSGARSRVRRAAEVRSATGGLAMGGRRAGATLCTSGAWTAPERRANTRAERRSSRGRGELGAQHRLRKL